MTSKQCSKCKETKPLTEFHKSKKRKDGHAQWCKKCVSITHKIRRKKRPECCAASAKKRGLKRRAILRRYKRMKGCIVCGENNPTCLVFHAPNGHKVKSVSQMVMLGWSRIKKEISICVVVCANCHMKLHAGEIELPE